MRSEACSLHATHSSLCRRVGLGKRNGAPHVLACFARGFEHWQPRPLRPLRSHGRQQHRGAGLRHVHRMLPQGLGAVGASSMMVHQTRGVGGGAWMPRSVLKGLLSSERCGLASGRCGWLAQGRCCRRTTGKAASVVCRGGAQSLERISRVKVTRDSSPSHRRFLLPSWSVGVGFGS